MLPTEGRRAQGRINRLRPACVGPGYNPAGHRFMIELTSQRWQTLRSAGGAPGPVPKLIRALSERDSEDAWGEVWEQLGHQWTLYPVAYAALPHLVPIAVAHQRSHTPDFLLSVGRLATPFEALEPCPPDLLAEFNESLRLCGTYALEAAATHYDDPRDYAIVLQAALALTGKAIPGIDLFFILVADDPGAEMTCPECSTQLHAQFEEPPEVFAVGKDGKRTPGAVPIKPVSDEEANDTYRWLASLCSTADEPEVLHWLQFLFGSSKCPKCGAGINILAEAARENEP